MHWIDTLKTKPQPSRALPSGTMDTTGNIHKESWVLPIEVLILLIQNTQQTSAFKNNLQWFLMISKVRATTARKKSAHTHKSVSILNQGLGWWQPKLLGELRGTTFNPGLEAENAQGSL